MDVLGIEVCAWGKGIEASGNGFNSDIDKRPHLAPGTDCSRTHLVSKRVVALNSTKGLSMASEWKLQGGN